MIDLDVYRFAAQLWLAGGDIYGILPPTEAGALPFMYPPVAAALYVPFGLLPSGVAGLAHALLSMAALGLVMVVVLRSLDIRPTTVLVGMSLPAALVLEPVRATVFYGQVNLFLMALVVLDCLSPRPRWPRGALVGLAAAIKLTPAAFVLFFLLRGDRRAAATALVSFLCVSAVGLALNPAGSLTFWTSVVFQAGRVGEAAVANQSLNGLLTRLGVERGLWWLMLAAVVVAIGVVAVRRATHPLDALGLNALVVLLVSPISWTNHWVWCVPILLAAWRARPALAVGGALLFSLSPHLWWETGVPALTVGNAYLWCAAAVLAWRAASRATLAPEPTLTQPRTFVRILTGAWR